MRICVLTSSRADFGIYLPLLRKLFEDDYFSIKIIAFGTHLSPFHGYTVKNITQEGFKVYREVESLILGDTSEAIATAIGLTCIKFSSIWNEEKDNFDLILCLGDRYEMLAAVLASVPFNIPVAHIHGGETTLGAIDNRFRHALTTMSDYHFTSTDSYEKRVRDIAGQDAKAFNVGALSLDNLNYMEMLTIEEFKNTYGIDLALPTVLVTFHPETVTLHKNADFAHELVKAMERMPYQFVITMPNADTLGKVIRTELEDFVARNSNAYKIESFGTLGYFSCMQYCQFLLGNTSSGLIEAASFGKYVINLGDRQKGRAYGPNVIHCPVDADQILETVKAIEKAPELGKHNIYGDGSASIRIIEQLKLIGHTISNSKTNAAKANGVGTDKTVDDKNVTAPTE